MSNTKKPISEKQLAAGAPSGPANAARSTGPRTPEGKARSARNSIKHGFTASSFAIIRIEDVHDVALLKEDLVSVYQPVNAQEMLALERMALAQSSMLRAARLETGLFTAALERTLKGTRCSLSMEDELCGGIDVTIQQNRNFLLAEGFRLNVENAQTWTLFLRYQAQAERMYRRALEEFERLKRLRPQLPNEPISECQPEENPPLYHGKDDPDRTRRDANGKPLFTLEPESGGLSAPSTPIRPPHPHAANHSNPPRPVLA